MGQTVRLRRGVVGIFVQQWGQMPPGREGQPGVDQLVRSGQPKAGRGSGGQGRGLEQHGLVGACGFFKATRRLGKLRGCADRGRATHGSGLVRCDGRESGPQHVPVIQGDGRVAKQVGGHGGGGVVPSPQARFQHGYVHLFLPEEQQGQNREKFKIGQVRSRGHDLVGVRGPAFGGPGTSVHADAFLGRDKVRRSVQTGFAAVGHAERGQKGRCGTLAVGAQNLDHREGGPGQIQGP